jgi:hypothetical protein
MDIGDLTPALDQETGFELSDPQLLNLLIVASGTFNAWAPQAVGLSGTTYDRELTPREQRLVVLFALASYLRGEAVKSAKTAVIHTNVAGRTDLTDIAKNIAALRKGTSEEILEILDGLAMSGGTADIQVHELGATLAVSRYGMAQPRPWAYWYL